VKNIGSNVCQRVTGFSLKNESLSTFKPRSKVAFQTLRTAGIFVQLGLAPVEGTKRPSAQPLAVKRLLGRKV